MATCRTHHRLKALPILILSLGLQLLPLCRQIFVAPGSLGSPLAIIFRWAAGAVALLGANHAVSGATSTAINSSPTASATVGKKFNYTITTTGYEAFSWSASGLPTNIVLLVNHLTNSTANVNTPVGTYLITLLAYEGFAQDGGVTAPFLLTLTVGNSPSISTQPANLTNIQGNTANFSVAVGGTGPFSYQWTKDGGTIVGATSSNLSVPNVQPADAGTYRVAVTTSFGTTNSLASRGNLTVLVPPSIDLDPFDVTTAPGTDAQLSVAASGTATLKYQWRFKGTNLTAGTNSLLTLKSVQTSNAGPYVCVVTNSAGSVTSAVATLTVLGTPIITSQPQSFTAIEGDATALSVTVNTTPLGYQWYFKNALLPGETDSSVFLNPIATNQAGPYFVVISNSYGSVTSDVATVTVLVPPKISLHPSNVTASVGGSAAFNVTATGSGTLIYRWAFNGTNIVGATNTTLTLNTVALTNGGNYSVTITNAAGTITSSNAVLTVNSGGLPLITVPPGNLTVLEGSSASFVVSASGSAPLSYFWRKDGSPMSGPVGSNFSIAAVTTNDAANYSVVVSNVSGSVTSSPAATLKVVGFPLLLLSNAPANQLAVRLSQFPGATYAVDFKNSFVLTNWQLWSNLPSVAAVSNVLLSAPLSNSAQFFRVRVSIP